jgi:hypothetical protein
LLLTAVTVALKFAFTLSAVAAAPGTNEFGTVRSAGHATGARTSELNVKHPAAARETVVRSVLISPPSMVDPLTESI